MAEFPELGNNCSVETCHQFDFLPFVCSSCRQIFCKDHRAHGSHNCPKEIQHQIKECVKPISYQCHMEKCEVTEVVPVTCDGCDMTFCLSHRHRSDHDCPKLEKNTEVMPKTKLVTDAIRERQQKQIKQIKTAKGLATAAKVQLMKLKMNSVGNKSLPAEERIYLLVKVPRREQEKGVFVSRLWSIGKVVDTLAELCDVRNRNSVGAQQSKLRMFRQSDGGRVGDKFDEKLCDLMPHQLYDGESVILAQETSVTATNSGE